MLALILSEDEQTLRINMSIAIFKRENCMILRKPNFLFRDAKLDTGQQLLAGEGQWVYTLNGDRY